MSIVSITIAIGFSLSLLYTRKHRWNSNLLRLILFVTMVSIGVVGFVFSNTNDDRFFYYCCLVPPAYILFDFLFKQLSFRIHNRDFYLWLRHSNEINESWVSDATNDHIKTSDMVFSLFLLLLIIGLTVAGIFISVGP